MAIGIKDVVRVWANRWRNLKVWRGSLDDVELVIRQRSEDVGEYSTGRAECIVWTDEQAGVLKRRVVVTTAPTDVIDSLGTVLHEYAHIAVFARDRDGDHGASWRTLYCRAASEVTGTLLAPVLEGRFALVDQIVNDALAAWWKRSGNAFAWKLIAAKGKRQ